MVEQWSLGATGRVANDTHDGRSQHKRICRDGSRSDRLWRLPRRPESAREVRSRAGGPGRQPGAGAALLEHRPRHPGSTGPAGMGGRGDRPAVPRPAPRVPGHEGLLAAKPQVHAGLCRGLARRANRATDRCTIALGSRRPHPRPGSRARGPPVLRRAGAGPGVVARRAAAAHGPGSARPAGASGLELPRDPAEVRLRPRRPGAERPLRVRLPGPRRRSPRARDRARDDRAHPG